MKRILGLLLIAIIGAGALTTPAFAQDLQGIIDRGEIVVAVDMTTPPWGYLDANQEPDGYGVALGQVLADSLGVALRIERVTGPTRIPTLLAGRVDVVISTLSVTAERAAQVWFTNPYAANPLVLIAPTAADYSSFEDLGAGVRIAVPRGSPQDQIVTEKAPAATIMRFDDDAGPIQALVSGQADLLGAGILVPPVLNEMDPGKNYETKIVLASPYMAMAVAPGAINLLQFLNTWLFLQKQNGKLNEISLEYLKIPAGDLPSF
jgi:polar amino acid transport system substrate-binding protein